MKKFLSFLTVALLCAIAAPAFAAAVKECPPLPQGYVRDPAACTQLSVPLQTQQTSTSPTVTASSAYAAGNAVGGTLSFTGFGRNGGGGLIESVVVTIKSNNTSAMDLLLFDGNLTGPPTDKTAYSLNAGDVSKLIGVVHITDCTAVNSAAAVCQATQLALPFTTVSGSGTINGVLLTKGTPTYGSTSDVLVKLYAPVD